MNTYPCCRCCETSAKGDHEDAGGTVPKDGHTDRCTRCQNADGTPALAAQLRSLQAALNFKQGIIEALAGTVERLEADRS